MLTLRSRAIAIVAAAAIAPTSFSASANAGSRHGDAVALAAIAGVFGTIATIAAANAARDRYDAYYGPRYAPGYGAYQYRGPVHGGPQWRSWHRRHWHG